MQRECLCTLCIIVICFIISQIIHSLIRLIASEQFSWCPNAVRRTNPSPLGPKPTSGFTTTLASYNILSKKSHEELPQEEFERRSERILSKMDSMGISKGKQRKSIEKTISDSVAKLDEYESHPDTLGERNSYSKTDPDATFMRMKEDAMNNGQTKPGIQCADIYRKPVYNQLRYILASDRYGNFDRLSGVFSIEVWQAEY